VKPPKQGRDEYLADLSLLSRIERRLASSPFLQEKERGEAMRLSNELATILRRAVEKAQPPISRQNGRRS